LAYTHLAHSPDEHVSSPARVKLSRSASTEAASGATHRKHDLREVAG